MFRSTQAVLKIVPRICQRRFRDCVCCNAVTSAELRSTMLRSQLRHLPLQRVSLTLMTQHAVQSTTARNAPVSVWVRQFSDMKNRVVKGDDVVKVNLRMGLLDKRMITPKEGSVVEFKVGANQLILQKVEEEVVGMKIAQRKDFICSAAEAFGELNVALFPFIPANELPPTYMQDLEVFHKLPPSYKAVLERLPAREIKHEEAVIAVTDKGITLDLNHPRAGDTILVSVYLLSIA